MYPFCDLPCFVNCVGAQIVYLIFSLCMTSHLILCCDSLLLLLFGLQTPTKVEGSPSSRVPSSSGASSSSSSSSLAGSRVATTDVEGLVTAFRGHSIH